MFNKEVVSIFHSVLKSILIRMDSQTDPCGACFAHILTVHIQELTLYGTQPKMYSGGTYNRIKTVNYQTVYMKT